MLFVPIFGFEGLYEITDLGDIRNSRTLKTIKPRQDKDGYLLVTLCRGTPVQYITCKVHRLVLSAFNPSDDSHMKVDHIDRNRTNNSISNLRWATDKLNAVNRNSNGSVRFRDRKNPWQAYFVMNGKFKSLGHYGTESEARSARLTFEKENNYGKYSQ